MPYWVRFISDDGGCSYAILGKVCSDDGAHCSFALLGKVCCDECAHMPFWLRSVVMRVVLSVG